MAKESKSLIVVLVVSAVIIVALIAVILFIVLGRSSDSTNQTNDTQTQSMANSDLEGCINDAHSHWDSEIAIEETGGNTNTGQSLLDQDIASCHQQYGY